MYPDLCYNSELIYVPSADTCDVAVQALLASMERSYPPQSDGAEQEPQSQPRVLGFDIEWRVTFERGKGLRPVATLQLSSHDVVVVFHLIHFENEAGTACPASLAALLQVWVTSKVDI